MSFFQKRTRIVFLLILFVGASVSASAQQADVLTPYNVAEIRSVSQAVMSPDGKMLAYTLSVPQDPFKSNDGPWTELHVVDLGTRQSRPFITGEVHVSSIAWLPDGESISFLTRRENDRYTTLYTIPVRGGEARVAVSLDRSVGAYDWHPDGKHVAFISSEPREQPTTTLPYAPQVYEEDEMDRKIWIVEAFSPDAEARMLDHPGTAYQLQWNPTGTRLAATIAPTPHVDDRYMYQRVYVIDALSGTVYSTIENPGKIGMIAWNTDGTQLALIAGEDINDPAAGCLMVASVLGETPTNITPDFEGHVRQVAWIDARTMVYITGVGVESTFSIIRLNGQSQRVISQTDGLNLSSLTTSQRRAAFIVDSPNHPREVYTMDENETAPRRLTNSNPWLDQIRMAPQEVVRFEARDGLEIEGLLIRPLDEEPGKRYPLILTVHGGPESHHSNSWLTSYSSPGQMAAARGMAVFYTNYRGSTGRGVAFSKLSQGDPAGKEFDDLVDAVDHLIETGLVDRDRIGVTGGSYGGYATAWLSTRYSDRFVAGVMRVGISNKISKVGTTDIPNEEFLVHALKRPWDDWQFFLERSPIYYAGNSETPLLILHGKDDPRVNVGQSREMYRHLKLHGKAPVRLVLYPGEQHGNRNASARFDYNLRSMRWMEHYLLGPGGDPPPYEIDVQAPVSLLQPGQ